MSPVKHLLRRPSAFNGLGLIATVSALSGPLCLEILFNHADLWFSGPWQDQSSALIWLSWTSIGLLMSTSWGLDRSFHGLHTHIHREYSLILSMIGVLVYFVFSVPTWVWLCTMSLSSASEVISRLFVSALVLICSASAASIVETKTSSLLGLIVGLSVGVFILWFGWELWVS